LRSCADLSEVAHYGIYGFRKQIAFIGIAQVFSTLEKDWARETESRARYRHQSCGNGFGYIESARSGWWSNRSTPWIGSSLFGTGRDAAVPDRHRDADAAFIGRALAAPPLVNVHVVD